MVQRFQLHASAFALGLLLGCAPPVLEPGQLQQLETGMLAFLQDGVSTREEISQQLRAPLARFEGGRIVTYDFSFKEGQWHVDGSPLTSDWLYHVNHGSCSLVLVFRPDGILARHRLVPPELAASPEALKTSTGQHASQP